MSAYDQSNLHDEERRDFQEHSICRCGSGFAIYPGGRCEACWNRDGQPLPIMGDLEPIRYPADDESE